MSVRYPWASVLPERLVRGLATMGPVGYWGKAPGTNGSVIGVLWYTVFFHNLGFFGQVILGLVSVV